MKWINLIVLLCVMTMPTQLPASTHIDDSSILIDVPWLVSHRSEEDWVIIDTRSKDLYRQGHIPGAINIPVMATFNQDYDKDRVANLQYIRKLFSKAGLKHDSKIIIYDDSSYIDAGRMFWVLELYGHSNIRLLNGGMPAWQVNPELAISKETTTLPESNYIPSINPDRLVTRSGVALAIDDPGKLILDARESDEYNGKESIANRFGHIPSAVNVPTSLAMVDRGGVTMLKDDAQLRQLYDGIVSDRRVYTYCNKGKKASLTYTILRQLGHSVAHYDGSWYEWGNDLTLPIVERQGHKK